MKVQIRDLKPNPFRDIDNYPINEEKVQNLTNSINQTGFWDNILARKNNGNIEIAYGHHRLIALQAVYKPDDYIDIPVKELDDSTMIRIMANENDESWGTSPKIINETVRVTKIFLEEHPEIVKGLLKKGAYRATDINDLNKSLVGRMIISRFLGGNWDHNRVTSALEWLGFGKRKDIDTEAIEMFEKYGQAKTFVRSTKQIKITPEQQREVAKRIVEKQDFSDSGMKSALLDEKYKGKEKNKEERDFIEFKTYVMGCTTEMNKLNGKLGKLLLLGEELKPNMLMYRGSTEARDFDSALHLLINILKEFLGKEETKCQKQIVSK